MSVKEKIHHLMKAVPFWADLADSIDQELILFQQDRVLPKKNFLEARTLDASNFYNPALFSSFDNYAFFVQNKFGWNPYSELWYTPCKPALSIDFPLTPPVVGPLFNSGWLGASGNNQLPILNVDGTLSITNPNFLNFTGVSTNYLDFGTIGSTPYVISTDASTLILNYIPTDSSSNGYQLLTNQLTTAKVVLNANFVSFVMDSGATSQVNFPTPLNPGQAYQIGLRFRAGSLSVFVNGVLEVTQAISGVLPLPGSTGSGITGNTFVGTVPKSTITINSIGNGTAPFKGQLGTIRFYHDALSDQDLLDNYNGVDLTQSEVRLSRPDSLAFMKNEAKGFGFRVLNRGNALFYSWIFNKAKMTGRAYQLFRDLSTNQLVKSITDPTPAVVSSLLNPPIEPFYAGAQSFAVANQLDTGLTLDQTIPWNLDANALGKTVAATKHFALEFVIGRGRNDFGDSTFPLFVDPSFNVDDLFTQKHLDYLTREALFGKSTVEFPHIGAQLLLACSHLDTAPRTDLYTKTQITIAPAFPTNPTLWVSNLIQQIKVYSSLFGASPIYQRNLVQAEIDAAAEFYVVNAMVPALAVGPIQTTGVSGQTVYNLNLTGTPIIPGTLLISFTDTISGTTIYVRDDSQGHLYYTQIVPDLNHWSGTVNYATGAVVLELFISGGANFIAGYNGLTNLNFNINATPISTNYKTKALYPIDKIELWSATSLLVTIRPPKLYFQRAENHLGLILSIDLTT
jgi:hypothetical protein